MAKYMMYLCTVVYRRTHCVSIASDWSKAKEMLLLLSTCSN
jgi:hypothetical protein